MTVPNGPRSDLHETGLVISRAISIFVERSLSAAAGLSIIRIDDRVWFHLVNVKLAACDSWQIGLNGHVSRYVLRTWS